MGGLAPKDCTVRSAWRSFSCLIASGLLFCALRGIRTPNRQIRRLVLYVHGVVPSAVGAAQVRCRIQ